MPIPSTQLRSPFTAQAPRHYIASPAVSRAGAFVALVGLGYFLVLFPQLARSIYVDAYSITATHADLVGYVLCLVFSAVLLAYGLRKRLVLGPPIAILAIFLVHFSYNIATGSNRGVLAAMVSRHSVGAWLILGMGAALSSHAIRHYVQTSNARRFLFLARVSASLFFLSLLPVLIGYVANSEVTLNYQSAAASSIIYLCLGLILLMNLNSPFDHSASKRAWPVYLYLGAGSYIVFAVIMMQSTGILAFWLLAAPVAFVTIAPRKGLAVKIFGAMACVLLAWLVLSNYLLDEVLENTRFSALQDGIMSVSSVSNRLNLLAGFWSQFEIAPLMGDMAAEMLAGYQEGDYMHSLPLSLLTHMGIVGTMTFACLVAFIAVHYRRNAGRNLGINLIAFRLWVCVLCLATLYAFFTWIPIWFLMGYLCVAPYESDVNAGWKHDNYR